MKTYIMMFGISNIVAGGPIYNANKIKFLEENGWNVIVFPTDSGKVYIKPLEKYKEYEYSFLRFSPFIFRKKKINNFLKAMENRIPQSDTIVIETGTDYTALWGELLAEKIGARHIVMFLDEKNNNVNRYTFEFYKFKYERNELYSISKESLLHIFSPYFTIKSPENNVWKAWCTNTVADVDSEIVDNLPDADFLIGSIGRLDKLFVPNIINAVCSFADNNKNLEFGLCLFGGADEKTLDKIVSKVKKHKNIKLYISGYIWPIPKKIFPKIDIFISGAGSARVSAEMGITTVKIDVITHSPLGFIDNTLKFHTVSLESSNVSLEDYLHEALINKNFPSIQGIVTPKQRWEIICSDFCEQINQIESLNSDLKYFETDKVWDHRKIRIIQKIIANSTNYKVFLLIQKIYNWIGGYGFKI